MGVRPDPRHRRDPLVQHAADFAAGRIPRVEDTPHAVRPFDCQRRLPVGLAVEPRAPLHQLADESRTVFDERPHRPLVAQAVARRQRVGGVKLRRISRSDRRGDPSLRVPGVAFVGLGFREDQHLSCRAEFRNRAQSRDATSDDEVVCGEVHAVSDPVILDRS